MQFIFYNSDSISNTVFNTVKTKGGVGWAKSKDVSNVLSQVCGLNPDLTELCGVRTMSAGFLVQPGTRFFSFLGARAAASCKLHSSIALDCLLPEVPIPGRMGRSGAARTAESAACARSALARRSRAPGAEPGRRSECALSALAAALRRQASQDLCLQPAGWCARARGVCVRAPVGLYSRRCLLNPLLGCTFHPECEHPGTEAVSYRRGRGGDESRFKFPSSAPG